MAYTIKPGDTLSGIAKQNNTTVSDLMKLNPNITNPNLIQAGASLNLAQTPAPVTPAPTTPNAANMVSGGQTSVVIPQNNTKPDLSMLDMSKPETWTPWLKQQALEAQTQKETKQKEQTIWMDKLKAYLPGGENAFNRETALTQSQTQWGVKPEVMTQLNDLSTQADSIRKNIASLTEQRDANLAAIEQKPISMEYITGEQLKAEKLWNSRINAESARLASTSALAESLRGNFELASNMADKIVDARTWDAQNNLKNISDYMSLNQDAINSLDSESKTYLNQAFTTAKGLYDDKLKEATEIRNMFLDAAGRGVNLGIDPATATLDQVTRAYSQKVGAYVAAKNYSDKTTQYINPQGITENLDSKVVSQIQQKINANVDSYKTNPAGYREKFIESNVKQFGEKYRNYIADQVYNVYMPDIIAQRLPILTYEGMLADSGVDNLYKIASDTTKYGTEYQEKTGNFLGIGNKTKQQVVEEWWKEKVEPVIIKYREQKLSDTAILKLLGL